MRTTLMLAAAALLAAACAPAGDEQAGADTAEPMPCTMIGCEDQLIVETDSALRGPYTVTLTDSAASGDAARRTFECPDGQQCLDIPFPRFVPQRVTVQVTKGGKTATTTQSPEYRVVQPNGPQCPPECRQARVRAESPGA